MRPGERQAARSRTVIKRAFAQLLADKGYGTMSVGDVADRAEVGRSTFYRHFKSKADVLVALHEEWFERLFIKDASPEFWLGEAPPQSVQSFVERHLGSRAGFSFSADIGGDVDYIMANVVRLMTTHIEQALRMSFPDTRFSIPVEVLASSISGVFTMTLMSWQGRMQETEASTMAEHVHRMSRSLVREGLMEGESAG